MSNNLTLSMPQQIADLIEVRAKETGISKSEYVRLLVLQEEERKNEKASKF